MKNPMRANPAFFRVGMALLAVAAVALLGLLYAKSHRGSPEALAGITDTLRAVRQLDSDWNLEVMSAKVGLNSSYDPVVAPLRKIRELLDKLQGQEGARDEKVAQALAALRAAFAAKADRIDSFKAHNSVLRNSLGYLPTAASEARADIARLVDGRNAPLAAEAAGATAAVLEEALKFTVGPDTENSEKLVTALDRLQALRQRLPESEPLQLLENHARTVLRRVSDEARLLSDVIAAPTSPSLSAVGQAFDAYFAAESAEASFWVNLLVAYSAALLVALAWMGLRLRQTYRQIRRANESLETRVQERTSELAEALKSLRESEVQLIQSEKMSSLGQMVAGVAHEINTPLAYVRSSLETVREQLNDVDGVVRNSGALVQAMAADEPNPKQLAEAFENLSVAVELFTENALIEELQKLTGDGLYGVDQISELVASLRNFSRLDRSKVASVDIRDCLDSALVIARSTIKQHQVIKHFEDLPRISCLPSQLNQVFLNLITNAAQALPPMGGLITISVRQQDGETALVEIADNGCGIAPEHLSRIFDPFFTTKEIGKGTGLGLSIVYKIVHEHGGEIQVQSEVGVGTRFTVLLPVESRVMDERPQLEAVA